MKVKNKDKDQHSGNKDHKANQDQDIGNQNLQDKVVNKKENKIKIKIKIKDVSKNEVFQLKTQQTSQISW